MNKLVKKLNSSRLIKLALIGIISLLSIKLLSYSIIVWIIYITSKEIDVQKIQVYANIVDSLNISISGSIAIIITSISARYGIREGTKNLTLPVGVSNNSINNEGGK